MIHDVPFFWQPTTEYAAVRTPESESINQIQVTLRALASECRKFLGSAVRPAAPERYYLPRYGVTPKCTCRLSIMYHFLDQNERLCRECELERAAFSITAEPGVQAPTRRMSITVEPGAQKDGVAGDGPWKCMIFDSRSGNDAVFWRMLRLRVGRC